MSTKIKLKNVRLSFPSLFKRSEFNGEQGKFEATFLLNKKEHAKIIDSIQSDIDAGMKENFKKKIPADKICLKDGSESSYTGYGDNVMSLKASNNKRPLVIDRDKSALTEDDNVLYAGCYVDAIVQLWYQDNNYGKRVNANLLGVQFYKDGEPFADGESADLDDFDDFDDDEDFLD